MQDNTAIESKSKVIPATFLSSFILVTFLFSLWGFANDITNPMVAAFKNILLISNFKSSLVQFAFYGGYFIMALPAALFIKRFNYKAGILVGLALYATGCLLFIPSGWTMQFWAFLVSLFILTCGLAFLETSANPYILAMGPEETSTQRLNFAQSFNPMGSITGMFVASHFILAKLDKTSEEARRVMRETSPEQFAQIQKSDLGVIIGPYFILGTVVLLAFLIFAIAKLPKTKGEDDNKINFLPTMGRLFRNAKYIEGVIAQVFYVGAQIMCWTYIIHYGVNELGMEKATAQNYNIVAMITFVSSRFVCTFLLKFFSPGGLLMTLAIGGFALVGGAIFIKGNPDAGVQIQQYISQYNEAGTFGGYIKGLFVGSINVKGMGGLFSLMGVSACMSLMFPTIYGISLKGLGDDAKLGAAGLIMAIVGGSVMPLLQGRIIDMDAFNLGFMTLSSTRASFVLPLICFIVIAIFGFRTSNIHGHK